MKHLDKIKHLGLFYAASLVVLAVSVKVLPGLHDAIRISIWLTAAAIVAFVTEDRQRHQEGRVKDGWDAYADLVGVILAICTYALLRSQGVL